MPKSAFPLSIERTSVLKAASIGICPDRHFAAGGKALLFIDKILI